jgi:predicted RNA methylase
MNYYDDPTFSYPTFWKGREYEHEAEIIALRRLLEGKHFDMAADIGGGFGRLARVLSEHAERVTLIDPSLVQRNLVQGYTDGKVILHEGDSERTGLVN